MRHQILAAVLALSTLGCQSSPIDPPPAQDAEVAPPLASAALAACPDGFTLRVKFLGLAHLMNPAPATAEAAWVLLPRPEVAMPGLPEHSQVLQLPLEETGCRGEDCSLELQGHQLEIEGGSAGLHLLQADRDPSHLSLGHVADLDPFFAQAPRAPRRPDRTALLAASPPQRLAARIRLASGTVYVPSLSDEEVDISPPGGRSVGTHRMADSLAVELPVCRPAALVLSRLTDATVVRRIPLKAAPGALVEVTVENHPSRSAHQTANHFAAHYALLDPSLDLDQMWLPRLKEVAAVAPLSNGVQCSPAQSGGGG